MRGDGLKYRQHVLVRNESKIQNPESEIQAIRLPFSKKIRRVVKDPFAPTEEALRSFADS